MEEIINFRTKLVEMNLVLITAIIVSLSFASLIIFKIQSFLAISIVIVADILSILSAQISIIFLLSKTLRERKKTRPYNYYEIF
jgi:hypothetical protein